MTLGIFVAVSLRFSASCRIVLRGIHKSPMIFSSFVRLMPLTSFRAVDFSHARGFKTTPYCTISLMVTGGWLLKNANYRRGLRRQETLRGNLVKETNFIVLKPRRQKHCDNRTVLELIRSVAPSPLIANWINYLLSPAHMINDLYQSIHEPRFVNHDSIESKINTLNINRGMQRWTCNKCTTDNCESTEFLASRIII